jgi:hypothetical protein
MRVLALLNLLFLLPQNVPRTAREYYDEIYKAGGLDRMADEYVCFADDAGNENFFIFGESKSIREVMIADGTFTKLPKDMQAKLKQDWLIVRGYAKGVPFDSEEFFDKDRGSWIDETHKLDANSNIRVRLAINWQTLRYKRAVEVLTRAMKYQSEIPQFGRCERVSPDVRQTAGPE